MKQALTPFRRRIRATHGVQGFVIGLLAAAGACLALTAVSFFVPIAGLWRYLILAGVSLPVLGLLVGLLWPVRLLDAARRADAAGLRERAITALAMTGEDTPIARVQRADAEARLKTLKPAEAVKVRVRRGVWMPAIALALVTAILLIVPNPQHGVLRAQAQVKADLNAQADEVEATAERLAEQGLTAEEARDLRRITSDMARELREATDQRDALERLDARQKDMDALRQRIQERTLSETVSALKGQEGLSGLGQALKSGSESEVDDALASIAEKLENAETREALADELAEAAEEAPEGAVQEGLSASASAAAAGNAQRAMAQLAGVCQSSGSSSASAMAASAAGASGASAGSTGANLDALMRMARSGASQAGGGSGSGGSGGAGAGSGAGQGSTNLDQGGREGMSASSGMGGSGFTDRVGAYEQIYDPTRLGGDSEASYVEGEKHEGDNQQITLGAGAGDLNGMVPYTQVVGEYQDAAAQAMRRTTLPTTLQDWVNRYFEALVE